MRLATLKRLEHSYPSGFSIKLQGGAYLAMMQSPKAEQRISACEAYLKIDPKNIDVGIRGDEGRVEVISGLEVGQEVIIGELTAQEYAAQQSAAN